MAAFVAGHRRFGIHDSEALSGDEARHRFAWLGPDVTAASYRALDGWVSPYEVTYGFARGERRDVRAANRRPSALLTHGSVVVGVETDRGTIATRGRRARRGPVLARAGRDGWCRAAGVGRSAAIGRWSRRSPRSRPMAR